MNYFSAILEPFGLRDAASLEGRFYEDRVQKFIGGLREVLRNNDKTEVLFSIHLCFLVDTSAERLIEVLRDLRKECLSEGRVVPFSAIVTKGKAEFYRIVDLFKNQPQKGTWRNPTITKGEYCNDVASTLFGRLTKLKAVAIWVDKSVILELGKTKDQVFESHFITDYSQARLKSFTDLLFRHEDLDKADVRDNILKEFRQTSLRSRKLGRFFIPLLVNWCHTSQLKANPPRIGPSLTKCASNNWLGAVRDGVGLEVVYCALLERLASQDKELTIQGSRNLLKHLAQQRWLRESAHSDINSSRYAHELLSEGAKRWFALKLCELEEQNQSTKSAAQKLMSKEQSKL